VAQRVHPRGDLTGAYDLNLVGADQARVNAVSSSPAQGPGKTMLLQEHRYRPSLPHHPEVILIVWLIDERPGNPTEMRATVKGRRWGLGTFRNRAAARHVQVAKMVIEKGETVSEHKKGRRHSARLPSLVSPALQTTVCLIGQKC